MKDWNGIVTIALGAISAICDVIALTLTFRQEKKNRKRPKHKN